MIQWSTNDFSVTQSHTRFKKKLIKETELC